MTPTPDAPRPRLGDHLRVAGLAVLTLLNVVPFLLWLPFFPILTRWFRPRVRRKLAAPPEPLATPPDVTAEVGRGRTVFVVAGERSGDQLAAAVIAQLLCVAHDLRVRGYGGPACEAAGMRLDRDLCAHAVFGIVGVVRSFGFWWRVCAETLARFRDEPPDLLLTVDFPGLNVRLARWARKRGIRTVHLVAPQVWAHTPWRVGRWRRALDLLLATLPFDPPYFRRSGIRTQYVGHPLFEAPLPPPRGAGTWPGDGACAVELWPGSRRREVERIAPLLLEAAADVEARLPDARFVVRLAEAAHEAVFDRARAEARRAPSHLAFATERPAHDAPLLGALATSGTATSELAVDLVPLSVFYRLGWIEWCLGHMVITAPWFCLVNLVLGRRAVPERAFVRRKHAASLASDFLEVAGSEAAWTAARADCEEVRRRLESPAVAERAARLLLGELA
jgi:lipid-A-disaccharide synthase